MTIVLSWLITIVQSGLILSWPLLGHDHNLSWPSFSHGHHHSWSPFSHSFTFSDGHHSVLARVCHAAWVVDTGPPMCYIFQTVFISANPAHVIIPILVSIFALPVLVIITICCIRIRNIRDREKRAKDWTKWNRTSKGIWNLKCWMTRGRQICTLMCHTPAKSWVQQGHGWVGVRDGWKPIIHPTQILAGVWQNTNEHIILLFVFQPMQRLKVLMLLHEWKLDTWNNLRQIHSTSLINLSYHNYLISGAVSTAINPIVRFGLPDLEL